jgi:glycosyltransferase involved in cell wall biosynthesis
VRILLINHRYFVASGAERYLFNVERELNKSGDVTAPFSIQYDANLTTEWAPYFTSPIGRSDEVYHDQHARRIATAPKSLARLFYSREVERDLLRMIDRFRPDVAYVLLFRRKLSVAVLAALKQRGVPIIARISDYSFLCEEHHFLRNGTTCTKCLGGKLLPSVLHGCVRGSVATSAVNAMATHWQRKRGYFDMIDRFVATNEFVLEMMVKGGFARERLTCIPTFVDEHTFRPVQKPSADYLLFAGRIDPSKGIETAIDAIAALSQKSGQRVPPLRIYGSPQDPSYEAVLRRRVEDRGVANLVTFHGHVGEAELVEVIANAAATVIPSVWFENLPNSYLESMSCGTPVIVSDVASLQAELTDGADALLFPPGNVQALADTITRLLNDPALASRLRRGGQDLVKRVYGARHHVTKLRRLFGELAPSASAQPETQVNNPPQQDEARPPATAPREGLTGAPRRASSVRLRARSS